MDYEQLASRLADLPWRDQVFETIGLMNWVVVSQKPTASQFRNMVKIVQDDFEQFVFRGGGQNGNMSISNNPQFVQHRDFLNDLYYPVMRLIAQRTIQDNTTHTSSDQVVPIKESIGNTELMGYLNDLLVDVDDDLLNRRLWLWSRESHNP